MSNILVAYFSASGYNRKSSPKVSQPNSCRVFEVQDQEQRRTHVLIILDWNDSHSRSTLEMKDPDSKTRNIK